MHSATDEDAERSEPMCVAVENGLAMDQQINIGFPYEWAMSS